jgi:hypothetical protein
LEKEDVEVGADVEELPSPPRVLPDASRLGAGECLRLMVWLMDTEKVFWSLLWSLLQFESLEQEFAD